MRPRTARAARGVTRTHPPPLRAASAAASWVESATIAAGGFRWVTVGAPGPRRRPVPAARGPPSQVTPPHPRHPGTSPSPTTTKPSSSRPFLPPYRRPGGSRGRARGGAVRRGGPQPVHPPRVRRGPRVGTRCGRPRPAAPRSPPPSCAPSPTRAATQRRVRRRPQIAASLGFVARRGTRTAPGTRTCTRTWPPRSPSRRPRTARRSRCTSGLGLSRASTASSGPSTRWCAATRGST